MKAYFTSLNIVFAVELFVVFFAALGVFPREVFLFLAGLIVFFILFSTLEDGVFFVARSIPLFVALPITESFDSFNIWRIVVLILFARLVLEHTVRARIVSVFSSLRAKINTSMRGAVVFAYQNWKLEFLLGALFIISVLSLMKADDFIIGTKRIIYFANLWMLFFVVRAVISRENIRKLAGNVLLSGVIVVVVGVAQLILAYTMSVDHFSEFWALQVNQTLYGSAWANIAIAANTWFAYYSGTIHFRMFSSFPDTHSFPLFLLMAVFFAMLLLVGEKRRPLRVLLFAWLFIAMFETVLSGTRGIWVSVLFPILFLAYFAYKKCVKTGTAALVALPLVLFLMSLPLSALVFNSTQFKLTGSPKEREVLKERIKSIIDFKETSNQGRVYIWKETIMSIARNPLLGVGIGNFPSILKLNPTASKAGASAHNLYLHFLAELGIAGFAVLALIIYEIGARAWKLFARSDDTAARFFALNWLVYFIWILWYSMTDVALFDERAFLLFMLFVGALYAISSVSGRAVHT